MGVCLTVIPVRRRRSQLPISKETPYRNTLCDPQGKAESTTVAGNYNPLRQGLHSGILKVLEI
ncbi:hypothetical protein H8356DRAFT_1323373 [Neocallimastix lanati (nom. inval.)]|nr:hypothetical protein H8356DRAFT_1323373 [Neocallimastix sp. JGI-2020a]